MKKFISILLVMTMLFSMMGIVSVAAGDATSVIVASDIHFDYEKVSQTLPKPELQQDEATGEYDINTAFITQDGLYSHVSATGQLLYESEAILDAFLKEAGEASAKYVILAGDLTHTGSAEASNAMASKLRTFENSTGKQVYVVPGNHDLFGLNKEQFKNTYGAFGYAEAIAQDTASASYVADIEGDYRLLMIDSTGASNGGYQLDEARVNWIKAQCEQAKNDKKHIIAVMHHNLFQHFSFDFIHEGAVIDSSWGLAEIFCEYDVKYTFSGHTHAQDIMEYTGANGNVIYEVVNGALNAYPLSYRVVDFSDKEVNFASKVISSIDTSKLANIKTEVDGVAVRAISDEAIKDANADFRGYAHAAFRASIKERFSSILRTDTLKKFLGVNYENNQKVALIIDKIGAKLEDLVKMPLYDKDKTNPLFLGQSITVPNVDKFNGEPILDEDGNPTYVVKYSIEEITKSYDGYIPPSHYKDLLDVLVLLYETHVSGGEGFTYYSDEFFIVIHSLAAALNYGLYSISEGEYGILIQFIANKFEPTVLGKIPSSIYSYMASGKEGFEQNILLMTYLISPLVKDMVSDSIPSDKNVTLGAYKSYEAPAPEEPDNQEEPEEKSGIAAFFDKIAEFFRMIFRILTFQDVFG